MDKTQTHNSIDETASSAHRAVERVAGAAEPAKQWVKESVETVRQKQQQALEGASEYVRERPLTYVGVALAVGMLIGALINR